MHFLYSKKKWLRSNYIWSLQYCQNNKSNGGQRLLHSTVCVHMCCMLVCVCMCVYLRLCFFSVRVCVCVCVHVCACVCVCVCVQAGLHPAVTSPVPPPGWPAVSYGLRGTQTDVIYLRCETHHVPSPSLQMTLSMHYCKLSICRFSTYLISQH